MASIVRPKAGCVLYVFCGCFRKAHCGFMQCFPTQGIALVLVFSQANVCLFVWLGALVTWAGLNLACGPFKKALVLTSPAPVNARSQRDSLDMCASCVKLRI